MANWIHDIEIKNFKSIRQAKIEDCRRINVFIGYPNTGKSNILEALSLISYLSHQSRTIAFKDLCRFKELVDVFYDGDKKRKAEILADDFSFSLEYLAKNEVELSIEDLKVEQRDIRVVDPISAAGITKGIKLRYLVDRDGKLSSISEESSSSYAKPIVKKYVFASSNFSFQKDADVLAFPFGENLAEVIRHNSQLRKDCGELFSAYKLRLIFDEDENILVQKQLDDYSAFQLSFSQIADTLQRLIFHKAAIASNSNKILLFEEPEAHMFPPYVSKFTTEVMYDENNNQFFIATHSPVVVNDFMENLKEDDLAIYAVGYKNETGETNIRRLTDEEITEIYQYGIDLFFNLERFLKDAV